MLINLRNKTLTHSVTASPVSVLPKIDKYRAVSMKLNCAPSADRLNSGLAAAAAARRSFLAAAAVAMEIVDSLKCAATEFQMAGLKLRLSPWKMSSRLKLPSCSIT